MDGKRLRDIAVYAKVPSWQSITSGKVRKMESAVDSIMQLISNTDKYCVVKMSRYNICIANFLLLFFFRINKFNFHVSQTQRNIQTLPPPLLLGCLKFFFFWTFSTHYVYKYCVNNKTIRMTSLSLPPIAIICAHTPTDTTIKKTCIKKNQIFFMI